MLQNILYGLDKLSGMVKTTHSEHNSSKKQIFTPTVPPVRPSLKEMFLR